MMSYFIAKKTHHGSSYSFFLLGTSSLTKADALTNYICSRRGSIRISTSSLSMK